MNTKKDKVYAIYWYDARGYKNDKGQVEDLDRMQYMRTIGVLREVPVTKHGKRYTITNIEAERHENQIEDLTDNYPEGTTIMASWIDKKVLIGTI